MECNCRQYSSTPGIKAGRLVRNPRRGWGTGSRTTDDP